MITLDIDKCRRCNICINRFKGYCISEKDGYPVFDYTVCNLCQKCVSICPSQAILVNNKAPKKIEKKIDIKPTDLYELIARRRSIKMFKEKKIARSIIKDIVATAKYAPNQNKNIDVIIVDDKDIIDFIDKKCLSFYYKIYKLLFSFWPLKWFFQLFSSSLPSIKRKMEYDLVQRKHIVKNNTQVLIILTGNKKVPTTENSAHYLLATMMYYATSLGIGSCLMDSLKTAMNHNRKIKKRLHIDANVLGVLSLGYSAENIVNIPEGYELNIQWNTGKET